MKFHTVKINRMPPKMPGPPRADLKAERALRSKIMQARQYVKAMQQTGDSVLIRFAERQLAKLQAQTVATD